ncbi:MAG: MarR family transcriptional regulator [Paracoccaceae bacterium]|nr:MarR family transcriptional regulator [Paracoccaceae bacterium]MDE2694279.1 MarR family transcriptional regulator [Paracoccaceae bacterium]
MSDFILENFLPYQLSLLANRISKDFSKEYISRFKLNNAEWRIIAHLSQENEAISIREIYSKVDLEKSKVSRAVSRLSSREILTKTVNLKDRRLVDLKLTKNGKKIIENMAKVAKDFESEVLIKIENPDYFRKIIISLIKDQII